MLHDLFQWVASNEGPLAYAVLSLAAALEYIFPPFPGDTITLFGVFLSVTAGYHVLWVYVMVNVGSVLGSLCAYEFGRFLTRHPNRTPAFLRREKAQNALAEVRRKFETQGSYYLVFNRFIPAIRAFTLVGAGYAHVPVWKVVVYGGLSSCAWNGLLVVVGYAIGDNWDKLTRIASGYSITAMTLVLVAIAVFAFVWWRRNRARTAK